MASIQDQMKSNSQAWHSAPSGDKNTQGTKEWYADQNQQLGSQIGGSYNSSSGTWNDSSGNSLYGGSSSANNNNSYGGGNSQSGGYVQSGNKQQSSNTVTYYDPQGNKKTGYLFDGKTYADPNGSSRIGLGSLVNTGDGNWYQYQGNSSMKLDPSYAMYEIETKQKTAQKNKKLEDAQKLQAEEAASLKQMMLDVYNERMNFQNTKTMDRNQADAMSEAQLRAKYKQNSGNIIDAYNQNAISRGMFGQLPTEALKQTALVGNELDAQSAMAQLAETLYNNDFSRGQTMDNQRLNVMNSQMGALGNYVNYADKASSQTVDNILKAEQFDQSNKLFGQQYYANEVNMEMQKFNDFYNKWKATDSAPANSYGIKEGASYSDRELEKGLKAMDAEMGLKQQYSRDDFLWQMANSPKSSGGGSIAANKKAIQDALAKDLSPTEYLNYTKVAIDILSGQKGEDGMGTIPYTQADVENLTNALIMASRNQGGTPTQNSFRGPLELGVGPLNMQNSTNQQWIANQNNIPLNDVQNKFRSTTKTFNDMYGDLNSIFAPIIKSPGSSW